ncbi:SDR family NAD(P)-dependent oxidoreductase [Arthrobacter sp. MSA 4-2]|uniref:SDR family NAD(P)-dependent oxidoreductase n=1 Tax=Arthrobacter sp. MSA 4-2 TaxID=2794349 RepID=UPI0018E6F09D|nr:SDR family NAD(P)-dependent oxidoreductase [Arthrobacter sp. MSA 4-2]MBJ2121799.1 SDR family NAD(P)-dependent oxidoreductase [Arthrobacter sp. MSA 4-2]
MGTRAGPPEGTPAPGDVVVITGASSGIGRATAHAFAGNGARLVLASRSPESLGDVVAECAALGARAVAVPTDVTREADVEALMEAALRAYGHVDAWIGCASTYSYGTFEDTPSAVFRRIVETTLFGQVHGARAVLPHFRAQGRGTLVLVGSVFSKVSAPYISPYVTGKFGLLGFAEVLRHEYRDAPQISICAVLPATIDTPIYQHAANYTGREVHPLPPVVAPERVARAIVRTVRRPRPVRVVGRLQGAAIPLARFLPGLYARCIHPLMDILALRRESTSPAAGTVFVSDPSTNRVTGGWRTAGALRSWPYGLRSARRRKSPPRGGAGEPAPPSGTGA